MNSLFGRANRLTRRLRQAFDTYRFRPYAARDPLSYWEYRARKLGRRAVLNVGHPDSEYEAVTDAQGEVLFPLLRERLRGDERLVLDYGCGAGRFSPALADATRARVVGADPIASLLDMAPAASAVEYRLIQDGRIPLDDGTADVIWICLVLGGIVAASDLEAALLELKRVLAGNGLVFLVENTSVKPDRFYWTYRTAHDYRELLSFVNLEHLIDLEDLDERLSVFAGRAHVSSGQAA